MRFRSLFKLLGDKIAGIIAERRQRADFQCEDCERVYRCGLAPSEECWIKAAHAARGWRRPPRYLPLG